MEDYLKRIQEYKVDILEKCHHFKKINVGFTNLLYDVDNMYIIKICNNKENENNFNNEIDFYLKNKNNKYIPKLYYSHISKSNDDFSFEIIEKIDGQSLYYLWHSFIEEKKSKIIQEIVKMMKSFHQIKERNYDWSEFITNKLKNNFNKCQKLNIFSEEDFILADKILKNIGKYLEDNDFRLIHSDIHFDNIILDSKNNLKIIDFETAMSAPIDYELDIFLRMCNNPFKYASEETEKYVKLEDYKNIEKYFRKCYPEIFLVHDFEIRHIIYNLEANLRLLPKFPNNNDLKETVLQILYELQKIVEKDL